MAIEITYEGKMPEQLNTELRRYFARLPTLIGREMVNFFKDRFRFGNWVDAGVKKWEPRKAKQKGKQRAVLVDSGKLRNSIRVVQSGHNFVVIGSDIPYARAHNEGVNETVNVRAHTRKKTRKARIRSSSVKTRKESSRTVTLQVGKTKVKAHLRDMDIPQRQFMGYSKFLERRLKMIIERDLNRILNS